MHPVISHLILLHFSNFNLICSTLVITYFDLLLLTIHFLKNNKSFFFSLQTLHEDTKIITININQIPKISIIRNPKVTTILG